MLNVRSVVPQVVKEQESPGAWTFQSRSAMAPYAYSVEAVISIHYTDGGLQA